MFNHVLASANDSLRKIFGLELTELMTRAERDKVGAADEDAEEDTGPGRKKKGASSFFLSSKQCINSSSLFSWGFV